MSNLDYLTASPSSSTFTSIESIEKSLSKTRLNKTATTICSLPFDVWRIIFQQLDTSDILKVESCSRHFFNLISRKNGDYIWRDQCLVEGIWNLCRSRNSNVTVETKSRLLCYLQTKSNWMLGRYQANHQRFINHDGSRGIHYIYSSSASRTVSSSSTNHFYSSSWDGSLSSWKLEMITMEKSAAEKEEEGLEASLFNAWFSTPPPTPSADDEDEIDNYFCNASLPSSSKYVKGIGSIDTMFHFNRPIRFSTCQDSIFAFSFAHAPFVLIKSTIAHNQERVLPANVPMSCLAISPSKTRCVGASLNVLYSWPLNALKELDDDGTDSVNASFTISHESIVFISFMQEDLVLCLCLNGDIIIFDILKEKVIASERSTSGLSCGYLSPLHSTNTTNSWRLLAGYRDGNIRSWTIEYNTASNTAISLTPHPLLCSLGDKISCLSVYENIILAGSWDGRLRLFDQSSLQNRKTLASTTSSSPILSVSHCLGLSSGNGVVRDDSIVTGHYDGSITVWQFEDNRNRHGGGLSRRSLMSGSLLPSSKRLKKSVI